MTVLFEPAEGFAAARCLAARSIDRAHASTRTHPTPCRWCNYEIAELVRMVDGFNTWAGLDSEGSPTRNDVRAFAELPDAEQQRLIAEAQGFPFRV